MYSRPAPRQIAPGVFAQCELGCAVVEFSELADALTIRSGSPGGPPGTGGSMLPFATDGPDSVSQVATPALPAHGGSAAGLSTARPNQLPPERATDSGVASTAG